MKFINYIYIYIYIIESSKNILNEYMFKNILIHEDTIKLGLLTYKEIMIGLR